MSDFKMERKNTKYPLNKNVFIAEIFSFASTVPVKKNRNEKIDISDENQRRNGSSISAVLFSPNGTHTAVCYCPCHCVRAVATLVCRPLVVSSISTAWSLYMAACENKQSLVNNNKNERKTTFLPLHSREKVGVVWPICGNSRKTRA